MPQQAYSFASVTPHAWFTPMTSVRKDRPPATRVGTCLSCVLPMPSSPKLLSPQHQAVPPASRPQVLSPPALTCTSACPPATSCGDATSGNVLLLPTCPEPVAPQQYTA